MVDDRTSNSGNKKKEKAAATSIQKRLEGLYPSSDSLPASISIQQAEELQARIVALEAKLSQRGPAVSEVPSESTSETTSPVVPGKPASRFIPSTLPVPGFHQPARFASVIRLWNRLTGAHPDIVEPGQRQQAQLASALSLGLGIFTLIGLISSALAHKGIAIGEVFLFIITLIVFLTYLLNRSRYYRLGSAALVIGFVAAGFGLALSNPGSVSSSLFSILPIALIVGGLLLPIWGLAIQTGVYFLAVALLPILIPDYTKATTDAGIYLTLGILLIISVAYRNSVERVRVKEVTDANMELESIRTSLEKRVEDRTHDLELASEVGRAVTEKVANLQEMLTEAVETIRARFNLYYSQVYLTDPSGRSIVLRAGTGEVGKQLLARGHRLLISPGSLNGRAVAGKRTIVVADTTQSANFLPNPSLPNTRSEMVVPLIVAGQTIGALDMQSEIPGALNETNQPAFEALAGQLSIAIQNANLFAENLEARQRVEANAKRSTESGWQEFLNGIERSERIGYVYEQNKPVVQSDAPEDASKNTLSIPIQITGATVGSIQNIEEDRVWTPRDRQIAEATSAQLARHIESLRLLAQSEHYRNDAEQAVRRLTREGWEAYLQARKEITPGYAFDMKSVQPLGEHGTNDLALTSKRTLTVRDESIGELAVETGSGFGESVEILDAVARQLSSHLENLRLSEQNEKRAYDLATVATVSTTASTVLNPDELLQAVVDLTKTRFNVYHAHVYLADESWKTLLLSAGAGEVGREMVAEQHAIPLDAEKSLVARAARERKAVIVNDVRSDPDFLPNVHLPDTRAEMAVPMIVGDKLLGVFDVQSEAANRFTEEDANIYTTLAAQVGVALQNARLYVEQAATVTQLRELDRLKSSFLANMSHELRTPLNSILGFADVILEELDGPLTENMHTDLGLIQKNGQHLLHLINDVLDMAKIEAGKMNLAIEKFNLQDTIEEVMSITSTFASEKNLSLFIAPDSDNNLEISADRTRLRQVMINLVNNSIKFTEKGKISIHVERQGDDALIKVKDTGIGIAPDLLESIFQEFVQVDTSSTRKVGGTGLGLPISRRLISMHGGRLWAESTGVSGEGSTFFVLLPLEAKVTETELETVK